MNLKLRNNQRLIYTWIVKEQKKFVIKYSEKHSVE